MLAKIPAGYVEKVYAGVLGKAIGVRLGAPLEPAIWTHDTIKEVFGEVRGYVRDYTNFAADDDTNGIIYFIRALEDYGKNGEISAEDIGKTWLNYTAENRGMFWWGGCGISTEHTAYFNLKNGINAPLSGSAETNGIVCAEQIGGQIFIDAWGMVCPGDIKLAAEYARKAASVSHDRNGIYGGMFVAACESKAFLGNDVRRIVEAGLSVIPDECEYKRMALDVIDFHTRHPEDFRECFRFVEQNYGYDRYPGACHVIPNAAVVILSLLYGRGDFARAIETAVMCGWDTDCNAGNVGAIMGVACGLEGIDPYWRRPINDCLIGSSVVGSLNIVDIPTFSYYLAGLGYMIAGEEAPPEVQAASNQKAIRFGFELPGSTHGFRLSNPRKNSLENSDEFSFSGKRSLKVTIQDLRQNEDVNVFWKPFYRRADFDDERYKPCFSPLVYPGQTVSMQVCLKKKYTADDAWFSVYVRNTNTKELITSERTLLEQGEWAKLSLTIPDTEGHAIDEAGLRVESPSGKVVAIVHIDEFTVSGKADYAIDFRNESMEFDGVTQFTFNRGSWTIEDGELSGVSPEGAETFTGSRYMGDYVFEATVVPKAGPSHSLNFRVQGAMRSYAVGFDGRGRLSLYKNDRGYKALRAADYDWEYEMAYPFRVEATGNHFRVFINAELVIECRDDEAPYVDGAVGFSQLAGGHTHYRDVRIKEL
ncbi:MAG: ADP-ribosylglycohydrolase family protein [Bacillota bacterium]